MIQIYITKLQNGNVQIQRGANFYSLNPDAQVFRSEGDACTPPNVHIKDKSGSKIDQYLVDQVVNVTRRDGTVTAINNDLDVLYSELANFFFFKLGGGGGSSYLGTFDNYTDLITQYPTASVGDLAYVKNSQGTWWLPGGMGGNFYSKGTYCWNGSFWESSVDEIAKQLEDHTNDILSLQTTLLNHVTDLNNPHQTTIVNLTDTNITSPSTGDVITFDGADWVNQPGGSSRYTSLIISGSRKKKATNSYLEVENIMSNQNPIVAYEDMILDTIVIGTDGAESWTGEVRAGGVLIPGGSLTASSESNKFVSNLNINVSQGTEISLYCNGNKVEKPRMYAIFKNQ